MTYPRFIALVALIAAALFGSADVAQAHSARSAYEAIWNQDRAFYAPGQPSPLVRFNAPTPGADAVTHLDAGSLRNVAVSRGTTRGLVRGSDGAREVIEWEWARVFGPAGQGPVFPRPVANALLRYRNGHGSPLRLMRSTLAFWGHNPRTIFDPADAPVEPVAPVDPPADQAGGGCDLANCPPSGF